MPLAFAVPSTDGVTGALLLVVLIVLVGLTALAWLAGRLLGVRRGFVRAATAGLVGFWVGGLAMRAGGADRTTEGVALLGYLVLVLLAMMLASIAIDVVFRPRSDRDRGMPHPMRALRMRLKIAGRIWSVTRIARRNGLLGPRAATTALTSQVGARRLRLTIEQSGGMLVKFGQIASTREDLLPPEVIGELSGLRMNLPPLPIETVRAQITAALGAPAEDLFAEFDPKPLGAASIGVTHRAVLHDGRRVIVKVRRPDAQERLAADTAVMRWATRVASARVARLRAMGATDLVDELIDGVTHELDFTQELANNTAMRLARGDDPGIYLPAVLPELTTPEVLVMDLVEGVSTSEEAARRAADLTGQTCGQLADALFQSFLKQVLRDGLFHADPHPGNVLICNDGRIALIDYGAVGRIDPVTLEALQLLAAGFDTRDASLLARAVRRMVGSRSDGLDIASLEMDMSRVLSDFGSGGFDPAALQSVFEVLARHGIPIPHSLTVLGRAALTLDGTLRLIDPTFRMGQRAGEQLSGMLTLTGRTPRALLTHELVRALPTLRNLPQLGEDLALQTRAGRLRFQVERFSGADGDRVQDWVDEVVLAVMACFGLLGSVGLLAIAGTAEPPYSTYLYLIGSTILILTLTMLLRAAAGILHRQATRARNR
jgi:ubiquinone biosynthesis protein